MKYGEAFAKLGYVLRLPRQDWTAEKADGVCITLWRSEIDFDAMVMDSRVSGGDWADWGGKHGNRLRVVHARRAIVEFDCWVDVVIVDGTPGEGVDKASPWRSKERKGLDWRITDLDEVTGHTRLEAQPGRASNVGGNS